MRRQTNDLLSKPMIELSDQSIYAVPTISSDTLASILNIKLKSMGQLIRRHKDELGVLRVEKRVNRKIYHLTQFQAYALLNSTRTNKDTYENRMRALATIIKQITATEQEQAVRQVLRINLKEDNADLQQAICDNFPENPFAYTNFYNLLYKTVTGLDVKALKKKREIKKNDNIIDYLTRDELIASRNIRKQLITLISMHLDYKEIKAILNKSRERENSLELVNN